MKLSVITQPTTEPVSLTEAKAHLRITDTNSDTLITSYIITAREDCEDITNRALAPQTLELILDEFPCGKIELPMSPVVSITSIKYTDSNNVETTLASTEYIFYDAEPAIIIPAYNKSWPSFTPYPIGAIKIRYVAGHTASNIPKTIKQAILLSLGALYENREPVKEERDCINRLLYKRKIWVL